MASGPRGIQATQNHALLTMFQPDNQSAVLQLSDSESAMLQLSDSQPAMLFSDSQSETLLPKDPYQGHALPEFSGIAMHKCRYHTPRVTPRPSVRGYRCDSLLTEGITFLVHRLETLFLKHPSRPQINRKFLHRQFQGTQISKEITLL